MFKYFWLWLALLTSFLPRFTLGDARPHKGVFSTSACRAYLENLLNSLELENQHELIAKLTPPESFSEAEQKEWKNRAYRMEWLSSLYSSMFHQEKLAEQVLEEYESRLTHSADERAEVWIQALKMTTKTLTLQDPDSIQIRTLILGPMPHLKEPPGHLNMIPVLIQLHQSATRLTHYHLLVSKQLIKLPHQNGIVDSDLAVLSRAEEAGYLEWAKIYGESPSRRAITRAENLIENIDSLAEMYLLSEDLRLPAFFRSSLSLHVNFLRKYDLPISVPSTMAKAAASDFIKISQSDRAIY